MTERLIQVPACDKCAQGVMDATNPHLLGTCSCECHAPPRAGDAPDHEAARQWAETIADDDTPYQKGTVAADDSNLARAYLALSSRAAEPHPSLAARLSGRYAIPVHKVQGIIDEALASPPVAPEPSEELMSAIEQTVASCAEQVRSKIPVEAWCIDYAGIAARSHQSVSGTPERGEGVTITEAMVEAAIAQELSTYPTKQADKLRASETLMAQAREFYRAILRAALSGSPARGEGVGS